MRASAAWAAVACALALAACGDDDSARRAGTAARAVAASMSALQTALANRDYGRICREIFSAGARARAGGRGCAAMVRRTSRGLARPQIVVREISLRGRRAVVQVLTRAAGQAPAAETVQLVRERGRWRVDALGPVSDE